MSRGWSLSPPVGCHVRTLDSSAESPGKATRGPASAHTQRRHRHQEPSESVPWGTYGEGVAWRQHNHYQPLPSLRINISSR